MSLQEPATTTSYDVVRYPSRAYAHAHPDRLAVVARLFGMRPPSPEGARILELGCGEGGHLLPIAAHLPGARCVGVDLAPTAIAEAQRRAGAAGLRNVQLEVSDIASLPDALGPFDYILCHGVFSWVGPAVREALLAGVRRMLAPDGVAYISYNAYPGWHLHRVARDIMRLHGAGFDDPIEQARQGMAMVRFLAEQTAGSRTAYGAVLAQQAEMTRHYSDAYFFHDFLSEHNEPLMLRDFVAMARGHGLQYVGDADLGLMMTSHMPAAVRETFDKVSHDLVELEQHLDLLRGTSFRRTLLCAEGHTLKRELSFEDLAGMHVGVAGRPESDQVDLSTDEAMTFLTGNDVSVTVRGRLGKAALMRLCAIHPATCTFEALCVAARSWANTDGDPVDEARDIGGVLLHGYGVGLVELSPRSRGQVAEVSERPVADAWAAYCATEGDEGVPNRRHEMVPLTRIDQALLALMDGTRDLPGLVEAMVEATLAGRLTVKVEGTATSDVEVIREAMATAVPDRIERFKRTSLLVG